LSKSRSLAGLRVGFAIGHPELIEALERIKNSFNSYPLDRLAQCGAVASFADQAYFEQCQSAVIEEREALVRRLAELEFEVLPSRANFVFCRHRSRDAAELAAALREDGIIVRHFKQARIEQYLRISVGRPEESAVLFESLKCILGG
jgi:histidinol-phosphate aminotransferase